MKTVNDFAIYVDKADCMGNVEAKPCELCDETTTRRLNMDGVTRQLCLQCIVDVVKEGREHLKARKDDFRNEFYSVTGDDDNESSAFDWLRSWYYELCYSMEYFDDPSDNWEARKELVRLQLQVLDEVVV